MAFKNIKIASVSLVLSLTLTPLGASADSVFKCKGSNGQIHYQGSACTQGVNLASLEVSRWETKAFRPGTTPLPTWKPSPLVLTKGSRGVYSTGGEIENTSVIMIVDTGAAFMSVPAGLADRLELVRGAPIQLSSANGLVTGYKTVIKNMKVGMFTLHDVEAVIGSATQQDVLMGQTALNMLKVEQSKGVLTISSL